MESKKVRIFSFFLVMFSMGFLSSSTEANNIYVGGKDGWVLNPSEDFMHWSHRNRFQVNDTLIFKYKKGSDSVLIVTKENFEQCNTTNPIKNFNDGASKLKIDRSGPWFFISGNKICCEKGEKVMIVVLSDKHKRNGGGISSSPQAGPSPASPIPSSSTPASSPSSIIHGDDSEPPAAAHSSASTYFVGSSIVVVSVVSVLVSVVMLCGVN